jgi:hypothetical protein
MSFNGAQKTYSIKVTFKDETRRLQLSDQNFNFLSLKKAIMDLMPSLQNQSFLIQWQDDEVVNIIWSCSPTFLAYPLHCLGRLDCSII